MDYHVMDEDGDEGLLIEEMANGTLKLTIASEESVVQRSDLVYAEGNYDILCCDGYIALSVEENDDGSLYLGIGLEEVFVTKEDFIATLTEITNKKENSND